MHKQFSDEGAAAKNIVWELRILSLISFTMDDFPCFVHLNKSVELLQPQFFKLFINNSLDTFYLSFSHLTIHGVIWMQSDTVKFDQE
jgi:hypothetical protein